MNPVAAPVAATPDAVVAAVVVTVAVDNPKCLAIIIFIESARLELFKTAICVSAEYPDNNSIYLPNASVPSITPPATWLKTLLILFVVVAISPMLFNDFFI